MEMSKGDLSIFESIMSAKQENRASEFLLWASLDFDSYAFNLDFNPSTHWGDKAYVVAGGGEQG